MRTEYTERRVMRLVSVPADCAWHEVQFYVWFLAGARIRSQLTRPGKYTLDYMVGVGVCAGLIVRVRLGLWAQREVGGNVPRVALIYLGLEP